jgi:hypothetical protein
MRWEQWEVGTSVTGCHGVVGYWLGWRRPLGCPAWSVGCHALCRSRVVALPTVRSQQEQHCTECAKNKMWSQAVWGNSMNICRVSLSIKRVDLLCGLRAVGTCFCSSWTYTFNHRSQITVFFFSGGWWCVGSKSFGAQGLVIVRHALYLVIALALMAGFFWRDFQFLFI